MDQQAARWVNYESHQVAGELSANQAMQAANRLRADLQQYGPEVFTALTSQVAQLDRQFPASDHLLFYPAASGALDVQIQHSANGQPQPNVDIANYIPVGSPPGMVIESAPPPNNAARAVCTVGGGILGAIIAGSIGHGQRALKELGGGAAGAVIGNQACK
jgi:hypothetical protein